MDQAELFRETAARANEGRDRTGWRYSASLRRLAVEYCRSCRSRQQPFAEIARALGVSTLTLGRWLQEAQREPGPRFREVVLDQSAPSPSVDAALAVVMPSGVRVEGLSLSGVIELARALL